MQLVIHTSKFVHHMQVLSPDFSRYLSHSFTIPSHAQGHNDAHWACAAGLPGICDVNLVSHTMGDDISVGHPHNQLPAPRARTEPPQAGPRQARQRMEQRRAKHHQNPRARTRDSRCLLLMLLSTHFADQDAHRPLPGPPTGWHRRRREHLYSRPIGVKQNDPKNAFHTRQTRLKLVGFFFPNNTLSE